MNEEDNLNLDTLDLMSVDTGFPVVVDGLYTATVAEIKHEPNKKGTGQNLKIKLTLNEPAIDIKGAQTNANFPIFDLVSLVISKNDDGSVKYDPRKRLAEFQEAVLGKKLSSFNPLEQYLGQQVTVRLKVEGKADDEFGIRNRVNRYVKKA